MPYQKRFIDRVLEFTLAYDHLLYCISNETWVSIHWSDYWIDHVRRRALEAGKEIAVTEMWLRVRPPDFDGRFPDHYAFVEVSQNNGSKSGDLHWRMLQALRDQAASRPVNNTKIYDADTAAGWAGDTAEAADKFWRSILGGAASARFHRPTIGLGLNPTAQAHIRSTRLLAEAFDLLRATPDARHELLRARQPDAAYLSHVGRRQFALYFPQGAPVELNLNEVEAKFRLRWLSPLKSEWTDESEVSGGAPVELTPPSTGPWVALLTRR